MSFASKARWTGAPLGVQVVILVVISLLAAELISVAVVFVTPPPRPTVYRVSELAEALKGGSLQTRLGRTLVRTVTAKPPTEPAAAASADTATDGGRRRRRDERERVALAGLLQVPESRVRLIQRPQSQLMEQLSGAGPGPRMVPPGGFRPPPSVAFGPPPAGGFAPPSSGGYGPPPPGGYAPPPSGGPPDASQGFGRTGSPQGGPGSPRRAFFFWRENLVVGDFTAAVQEPSGQWIVVRPSPEPFPNDWQRRIALWLLGCVVVLAPLAWLFARRITAPFDRFAAAAEALGRDPNAPPMELSGPSEIGKAAQAFNDMQARLRRYVGDRTAMVGAISHDLRTPLARIRFKLEGAPEPLKRAVLSDVEKMDQMIGGVLAFIRDASEPRLRQRLDLLSLAECVADDADAVGGDVEIVRGYPYAVDGDPIGLQRMLANLVDNAVKYGVRARIRLFEDEGEAVIEIADEGPGLPPAELERVFQPFYRSNTARTLKADSGVGLGLSVARSIARAHGGEVELAQAEQGLIARVRLPLAAPAA
jgi:signal transduction histidine kinase